MLIIVFPNMHEIVRQAMVCKADKSAEKKKARKRINVFVQEWKSRVSLVVAVVFDWMSFDDEECTIPGGVSW